MKKKGENRGRFHDFFLFWCILNRFVVSKQGKKNVFPSKTFLGVLHCELLAFPFNPALKEVNENDCYWFQWECGQSQNECVSEVSWLQEKKSIKEHQQLPLFLCPEINHILCERK